MTASVDTVAVEQPSPAVAWRWKSPAAQPDEWFVALHKPDVEMIDVYSVEPLYAALTSRVSAPVAGDDVHRMEKISELISRLQSTKDQFGDTCVYIRRGGLAWGAVALNRRDDDKKHGVFDLQAQHDRDMIERLGQIYRLRKRLDVAEQAVRDAAPSPALDPATVEACARELEQRYPDHKWVNAYCAAIRALAGSVPSTVRADEPDVEELADVAEAHFLPIIGRLRGALETAAARFNLMGGVGLVNGADPKVGYRECMEALSGVSQTNRADDYPDPAERWEGWPDPPPATSNNRTSE